jgi:signal transduction histidine kinase
MLLPLHKETCAAPEASAGMTAATVPLSAITTFLEGLGVPALVLDQSDCTLCWNLRFLELFPEHHGKIHAGEPYAENLLRFYRKRLDDSELPNIDRYIAEGVARHRRQLSPYEFIHRGRWIRVSVLPLPGVGRLRSWIEAGVPPDGDQLAGSMAKNGKLVALGATEEIADGLAARDPQGRIVLANRRLAEIYGLDSPAASIDKTFPELIDIAWAGAAGVEEAHRRWIAASNYPGAPVELPLPGDRWVRVLEHRAPDGSLVGTHVDVTDLYRLRRSATEGQERAEALAALLRSEIEDRKRAEVRTIQAARLVSLGAMATGLAHELTQPLSIVTLKADNARLALEAQGAAAIPATIERLEQIAASAVRARGILDHLECFARPEADGAPPEPLNLQQVVEGARMLTESAFRSAGITLKTTLPPTPPWVMGHRIMLEQVVLSLLLNARDAVEERRVAGGWISLHLAPEGMSTVLTIADSGGGFAEDALERAFEPFFTTKDPGKGVGLGLPVAYSAIRAMGGSITLLNGEDGAVVTVTLPSTDPATGAE